MCVSVEEGIPQTSGRSSRLIFHRNLPLILAGILIEFGLIAFWLLSGVWRGSGWLMTSFLLPTLLFFALVFYLFRDPTISRITASTRWIILGFAALYHLTMLFTPDPLSNDLYRYLWDGKVLAHGINPYAHAPAAVELTPLRDADWEMIFNRDISTGYPPLVEIMFAGNHLLGFGRVGIRMLSVMSSLGTCVVLMAVLRHLGEDERKAIVYAWSPLVALEFGNSGHLDSIAILFLATAFLMHVKRRPGGTAFFLALGGLVKFFPALLVPIWGRRWGGRSWIIFGVTFAAPWLPFILEGSPFSGLGVFASRGEFNASLYAVIENLWALVLQLAQARLAARVTSAFILAILCAFVVRKIWRDDDPRSDWGFAALVMGWALLLSPVVHPWYICWMLAFICIEWETAWLVLSGSVIFARHVYLGFEANGVWREAQWSRWAVYLPFYLSFFSQRLRSFSWIKIRKWRYRDPRLTEGVLK